MVTSISVPPAIAYGAGEALPDTTAPMSVADAAYHTAHGYPGGIAALAARMGVSVNTLTHKANPNNDTHHLRPDELLAMQYLSGDVRILHAMAAQLGYTCTRALPDQNNGNIVEALMREQVAHADFIRAVADPLARMETDPNSWVTPAEVRRASAMAGDLHTTTAHVLGAMRASLRPEPKTE